MILDHSGCISILELFDSEDGFEMVVVSTHSSVRTAAADSKAPARIAKVTKNEQRIAFFSFSQVPKFTCNFYIYLGKARLHDVNRIL